MFKNFIEAGCGSECKEMAYDESKTLLQNVRLV
jgi:hypothetical protein